MIEIQSLNINQEMVSVEFEFSGEFRDEYTPMLVIFRALIVSAFSVEPSIKDLAKSLPVCETAPTRWVYYSNSGEVEATYVETSE